MVGAGRTSPWSTVRESAAERCWEYDCVQRAASGNACGGMWAWVWKASRAGGLAWLEPRGSHWMGDVSGTWG